jgi:hypothetical protein
MTPKSQNFGIGEVSWRSLLLSNGLLKPISVATMLTQTLAHNEATERTVTETRMTLRVMRQKNMVMSPEGPRTKNNCAGKGQHQFT